MKIALIGASGYTGKPILVEASRRGHEVTAILRNPEKLDPHPALNIRQADLANGADLTDLVTGHQAIISAYNPGLPQGRSLQTRSSRRQRSRDYACSWSVAPAAC